MDSDLFANASLPIRNLNVRLRTLEERFNQFEKNTNHEVTNILTDLKRALKAVQEKNAVDPAATAHEKPGEGNHGADESGPK